MSSKAELNKTIQQLTARVDWLQIEKTRLAVAAGRQIERIDKLTVENRRLRRPTWWRRLLGRRRRPDLCVLCGEPTETT